MIGRNYFPRSHQLVVCLSQLLDATFMKYPSLGRIGTLSHEVSELLKVAVLTDYWRLCSLVILAVATVVLKSATASFYQ